MHAAGLPRCVARPPPNRTTLPSLVTRWQHVYGVPTERRIGSWLRSWRTTATRVDTKWMMWMRRKAKSKVLSRVRTCSRNPRMFSNLTCLFEYPRMFSNLAQCSRMFSKRIVFKLQLFWPYVGINRVRHYTFSTVWQHPVPTRTWPRDPNSCRTSPRDPNSCRTNARQPSATCDAHFGRRRGAEA